MKYLILGLIVMNLCLSCKKHAEEPPPISADYWGEASALKNGKPWAAHPVCWNDDESLGGYDVLETEHTNQIVLEALDTISKELRGTFNLTYIIHGDHIPGWPDTVRLTDGKFHGKLIKK